MKKFSLLAIFFTISTYYCHSQGLGSGDTKISDFLTIQNNAQVLSSNKYSKIQGSPYNNEEFQDAEIHFKNGRVLNNIPMRVNLYEGALEFKKNNSIYVLSNIDDIEKVKFGDKEYALLAYSEENRTINIFAIPLIEGNCSLYQREIIDFQEEQKATNNYTQSKPASFVQKRSQYLLSTNDNFVFEIKNKKDVFEAIGKENQELSKFIKSNKLNPKDIDDLSQIVRYCNKSI